MANVLAITRAKINVVLVLITGSMIYAIANCILRRELKRHRSQENDKWRL